MKICHVCKAECEDEAELCPVCGADLTKDNDPELTEEVILQNPTLVATVEDVVSSEIFKDLLKENGIPFSSGEIDEGTLKVTFGGSFISDDIYVEDTDFEKASQIYDDFLNTEPQFEEDFFEDDGSEK